jgi:hypothetical protein
MLYHIAVMPKGAAYWDAHPAGMSQRDTVKVQPLKEGGYETSIIEWHPDVFARKIQRLTKKYIAPDKHGGRDR